MAYAGHPVPYAIGGHTQLAQLQPGRATLRQPIEVQRVSSFVSNGSPTSASSGHSATYVVRNPVKDPTAMPVGFPYHYGTPQPHLAPTMRLAVPPTAPAQIFPLGRSTSHSQPTVTPPAYALPEVRLNGLLPPAPGQGQAVSNVIVQPQHEFSPLSEVLKMPRTQVLQGLLLGAGGTTPCADENGAMWNTMIRNLWPRMCKYGCTAFIRWVSKLGGMESVIQETIDGAKQFFEKLGRAPFPIPMTVTWINEALDDSWCIFHPLFQQCIRTMVVPKIKESMPKSLGEVTIDPCDMGYTPIKVVKADAQVKTMLTPKGPLEYIDVCLKLEWRSDMNIKLALSGPLSFEATLKGIELCCDFHICFAELTNTPPFVGGVDVWMPNNPELKLDWSATLLGVVDLDMFQAVIQDVLNKMISKHLVLPNRKTVTLDSNASIWHLKCPVPVGMLRVELLRASGLRCDDFILSSLWTGKRTSDPFVVVEFGAKTWRSKTVKNSEGLAEWEEEMQYFLVDEPLEQTISFAVFDEDQFTGHDLLANKRGLSLAKLLGIADGDTTWTGREITRSFKQELEVVWIEKNIGTHQGESLGLPSQRTRELIANTEEEEEDNSLASLAAKGMALLGMQVQKAEEWFQKQTGADPEMVSQLNSELELRVTWRPFELNEAVARNIKVEENSEKFSTLLFVGLGDLTNIPIGEEETAGQHELTRYHAKIECLPVVSEDGELITAEGIAVRETAKFKMVQVKASDAKSDEERAAIMRRKILLLFQSRTPLNVISEVLDVEEAQVATVLRDAVLSSTSYATVKFGLGFFFLLHEPKAAKLKIEIFRTTPRDGEQLLGHLSYDVANLLGCDKLSEHLVRPLGGSLPGVKLDLHLEMWVPFDRLRSERAGRSLSSLVSAEMKKNRQNQNRVVFLDRMGRQRVQVDGLWVEEEPQAAESEQKKPLLPIS